MKSWLRTVGRRLLVAAVFFGGVLLVRAELPAGYTALDWIASSGTQYIKTGYVHKTNTKVECEVFVYQQAGWGALFGARNKSSSNNAFIFWPLASALNMTNLGLPCYCRCGTETVGSAFFPREQRVKVTCEGLTAAWQGVDDTSITGSITTDGTVTDGVNNMYIFNLNTASGNGDSPDGSYALIRLYSFRISEGDTVKHDYVPCRNAAGVAGLWDQVDGAFLTNAGTGVFAGSDVTRPRLKLNWINVPAGAWINTEFKPNQNTRTVMDVDVRATGEYWFGAWNDGYNKGAYALGNDGGSIYTGYGNSGGGLITAPLGNGHHVVELDKNLVKIDGETRYTHSTATFQVDVFLTLFVQDRKKENKVQANGAVRCRAAQIYDNGTLIRDFQPVLAPWGGVGFVDEAHDGTFYGFSSSSGVTWDLAYLDNGTTRSAYAGKLVDADLEGVTAFEMDGANETLNAAAVKNYAMPVTLKAGTFSLMDHVVDTYSFESLVLKGGVRLVLDASPTGCDALSATSLTLDATADNPVQIQLMLTGGLSELGAADALPILSGVTSDDLAKFRLMSGMPAKLGVREGNLVVVADPTARTLPEGYTPLAYIASSGSQYILTGVNGEADTIVEMTFGGIRYGANSVFFGEDAWNANRFLFNMQSTAFCFHSSGVNVTAMDEGSDWRVWIGGNKIYLEKEGNSVVKDAVNTIASGNKELAIFATNTGSNKGSFRLYTMKIMNPDGTRLRDFVPCRNPDGEPGLWDYVSGNFFRNAGTGHFFGPDDEAVRLTRMHVGGGAYIDTGFVPDQNSRAVVDVVPRTAKDTFFGVWGGDWNIRAFALSNDGSNMYLGFGGGYNSGSTPKSPASVTDGQRHTIELDRGVVKVDDEVRVTCNDAIFDAGYPLFFFAQDRKGTYGVNDTAQNQSIYRAQVYDNGALVRDFVPYRLASGEVGMVDIHGETEVYYPNKNYAANAAYVMLFDAGIAYTVDGTTLKVHEGEMVPEDLGAYTDVQKVDWYELNATQVTNYPGSLAILKGKFSVADGVATRYAVAGALTLAGGSKLAIDITADGHDTFAAASVVLDASATTANPVLVSISSVGITALPADAKVQLFPGQTFTPGDELKFRTTGLPTQFTVEEGRLYLVAKEAGMAVWTGGAGDGKWSSALNWRGGEVPEDGMTVKFDLAAGGETTFDLAGGRSLKAIVFCEEAGAFSIGGEETLGVTDAITNLSTQVQSVAVACTFGIAGLPFEFACTGGDLSFSNVSSTVPAETLVKSGEGQLTLADTTLRAAANMMVRAGLLKTTYTARVTAATPQDGALTIEAGGMLDVDRDLSNSASIPRMEPFHGKTIYIAGDGDGRGALYNSYPSVNWGTAFGKVVLTGDASVGGTHLSVRPLPGSRIPGATIEGPYTFTVKTIRYDPTVTDRVFSFTTTTFALDRLNVTGYALFEGVEAGVITNGVHLYDGGGLHFFTATVSNGCANVVTETGTSVINCLSASTMSSDFLVKSGTTMNVDIGKNLTVNGTVTVEGTLAKTAGAGVMLLGGAVKGSGAITGTGVRFNGAGARWEMAADETGWTSKADLDGATDTALFAADMTFAITYTGTQKQSLVVCNHCNLTGKQVNDLVLNVVDGAGETIPNCWLGLDALGRLVLTLRDEELVRTATWMGGADSALDNPANWVCRNDSGVLEGKLPMGATIVTLPDNCVFNCTNGAPFTCLDVVTPAHLGGDCDWSGLTMVSVTNTLDLQGHKLYLPTLAGTGTITDTTGVYLLLDSITAPKNAWLDTGFLPTEKTRVVMDLQVGGAGENWFGTTGGAKEWWKSQAFAAANDGKQIYVGFGSSGDSSNGAILPNGWRGKVDLDRGVFRIWPQGAAEPTERRTLTSSAFTAARSLWLFANNTANANNRLKDNNNPTCFGCQVYENGVLVRDYVPAKRLSDGVVGMIDRVRDNTFTSSGGTVAFTASMRTRPPLVSCGELHVVVAEGRSVNNSTLNLAGNLTLVKEGPGELTMTKQNQTYAGGTEVREGLAYAPVSGSSGTTYAAKFYQWGGGDISVYTNATFDTKGNYDYNIYNFKLVGGTLANTGCDMSVDSEWGGNGSFTLLDDSTLLPSFSTRFTGGTIDLGGYTLTVPLGVGKNLWFRMGSTIVTNGTLNITSGGWFHPLTDLDMHTVDVVMNAALDLGANVDVRNYEQRYGNTSYKQGSGQIRIHGIYTPTAPGYIQNFVMCNGSTFNLGALAGTFAINGQSLSFADGATMTVDIGKRPASNKTPVIGWGETPPANLKDLTFKAPQGARYRVYKGVDGVYVTSGLMLILR